MKRGDVVLMLAPRELGRPRPGIVVQADELKIGSSTVLVCPLSSDLHPSPQFRPIIDPDPYNGLRVPSQAMTDKMTALKHEKVRSVIGRLDDDAMERIDRALMIVLGLAR